MCWVCNRKCPLCSQEAGWLVWSVKREGLKCVSDRQRVRYQVKTSKQAKCTQPISGGGRVKKPNVAWPGVDVMYTAVVVCVLDRESHPTACFPFGPDLAPSFPPLHGKKKSKRSSKRRTTNDRYHITATNALQRPTIHIDIRKHSFVSNGLIRRCDG